MYAFLLPSYIQSIYWGRVICMNIKQEDSLLGSSSTTVFVGYWVGVSVLVIVVLGRLPFSSISTIFDD